MQTDLIEFVLSPLQIDSKDFMAKLENDPVLKILIDNKHIFSIDTVYPYLVDWVYFSFRTHFDTHSGKLKTVIYNKERYLKQLLYLFAPSIHVKFFHQHETYFVTTDDIIEKSFTLLMVPKNVYDDIQSLRNSFTEVDLVW